MAGEKTADKAVGRTKGELNIRLHAVVTVCKTQWSSSSQPEMTTILSTLLNCWKSRDPGSNILAGRAYGARAIPQYISEHRTSYVIAPKSNVSDPWPVDWHLYRERHLVECFFQKIKWFCRISTHYDKLDASLLAFVYLASIAIFLIKHYSLDFSNRS